MKLPFRIKDRQVQGNFDYLVGHLGAVVRGQVTAAGAITSGRGFTVSQPGTGTYLITFTQIFNPSPIMTIAMFDAVRLGLIPRVYAKTDRSVNIAFETPTGTLTNVAFDFTASEPS